MQGTTIYLNRLSNREKDYVKLVFKKNMDIINKLKNTSWIQFGSEIKCYYFENTNQNISKFYSDFGKEAKISDYYLSLKENNYTAYPTIHHKFKQSDKD